MNGIKKLLGSFYAEAHLTQADICTAVVGKLIHLAREAGL